MRFCIIRRFVLLNALRFLRLFKWNLKIENTALAQFAFHPNFPTVTFGNGFNDGEPQPRAAFSQRFTVRATIEFFEQARHITFWNSDATILYCKGQSRGGRLQMNSDLSAFRRVFEGILYKIIKSLMQ